MSWETESVALLRGLLMDDETPYEYSDVRLQHVFVVSFFQMYQQARDRLARVYVADSVNDTIVPDPAGSSLTDPERDETAINLGVLKAACMLQQGAIRKAANAGFAIKDNDGFVDTRGKASALLDLHKSGKSYCAEYEAALRDFLIDAIGTTAAAVIGPFRYGGASSGGRRPADGTGRRYFG